MDAVGEQSVRRNSPEDLKSMFKTLFEAEYYSHILELQKSVGLHIRLETQMGGTLKNIDLQNRILEDILNSNGPLSTLVLGDSGTGKSWLALKLAKKLYDSTKQEFKSKIPVYIPLGRIEKMISQQKAQESSSFRSDILFSYIMNHRSHFPTKIQDGELQNLYLNLCACELILILDGYDELKVKSNLWEENKWKTKYFTNVRTIVFCRPNAFVDVDISKIFGFSTKEQSSYFISRIMRSIVEKYISHVPLFLNSIGYDSKVNDPWMMAKFTTKDHPKWESAQEDSEYKYWFLDRLPELQGLAQNVFILTTICQLLPKLVESERKATEERDVGDEFVQKLEEICRTEVLLYDKFTQAWFKYQIERMEPTGHAHVLYESRHVLRHYMVGYAQNLAMRCASLNEGKILNGEISEGETLFWNLWTPWSPYSKKFKREKNIKLLEKILFPQNEKDKDNGRIENLKFLRDCCMLRYNLGCYAYEFLHLSLFEYFLSREVFEKFRGVLNYYSNWNRRKEDVYFPINQKNINNPELVGVLSMLVGRAKADEKFQFILLETVRKSATLPGIEQMASNAFTILNLSGYNFSGRNNENHNFQNIQVPGANFRNSVCGNSDFSGANFEDAELNQGWFQGCKFQGVNFSNCSFGQIPSINLGIFNQHMVLAMLSYSVDNFCHVVMCYTERTSTSDVVNLYLESYKFQNNFELIESKATCLTTLHGDDDHSFFLMENTGSVILLDFVSTSMIVSDGQLLPDCVLRYWYEFKADSLVDCGTLDLSNLSLDFLLNYSNQFEYEQKYIVFFPDQLSSVFVEKGTFERYGTASDCVCCIKFFGFGFGRFKLLVSIRFEYSGSGAAVALNKVLHFSLLHDEKPIICNDEESFCFELFWQIVSNEVIKMEEKDMDFLDNLPDDLRFAVVLYDGRSLVTFLSIRSIYLFDIKHHIFLGGLKNPKGLNWGVEFLEKSSIKKESHMATVGLVSPQIN